MQIRPFEELEAEARERYRARFASVPEPTVLNIDALVQFTAPRAFVWGGVGYRAPPLPFVLGVRMLVEANALRDVRGAGADLADIRKHHRRAVRLILQTVAPARLMYRILPWKRDFFGATPEDIESLLRWLIHVMDDSVMPPPEGKVTVDFMDGLAGFVHAFPSWLGADGLPLSWPMYVYGSRHLSRARAREDLRHAMAVRAGGAESKDYKEFNRNLRLVAGW